MLMYVLKRHEDGRYVADMRRSRTGSSYTRSLEAAKKYRDAEAARGDACGNESPVSVESLLGSY